jgi:hypothetical protein
MLAYHRAHVDAINHHSLTVTDRDRFNDQATFNDTTRFGPPNTPVVVHTNETPNLVYTMGTVPPEEYTVANDRIWVGGFCPPVIHQYDRRDRAFQLIRHLFPYWPGWPA